MPNDPSNTLQAVEDAATELAAKTDGPPGVIVVVQRRNDRRVISAGVADLQTGARLRVDDHMRLASVSKAFNGATALSLVARQVLRPRGHGREVAARTAARVGEHHAAPAPEPHERDPGLQQREGVHRRAARVTPRRAVTRPVAVVYREAEAELHARHEVCVLQLGQRHRRAHDRGCDRKFVRTRAAQPGRRAVRFVPHDPPQRRQTPAAVRARLPARRHGRARRTSPGSLPPAGRGLRAAWFLHRKRQTSSCAVTSPARDRLKTHTEQFQFIPGGSSDPPGPGSNSAGLAIFRYETRCGTVYGHTGNIAGYTQFVSATADGERSATVSINAQLAPEPEHNPVRFAELRQLYELAVCAALD